MEGPGNNKGNIFGLLALIFGITAVVLSWCCGIGLLPGAAAIVLGILGMRKANEGKADNKTMALVGLILGIVGVVASVLICGFADWSANWNDIREQMDNNSDY